MISLEKIIFIETQSFLSVRLDKIVINKRYMQRKCVHVYRAADFASRATFYVVQGGFDQCNCHVELLGKKYSFQLLQLRVSCRKVS